MTRRIFAVLLTCCLVITGLSGLSMAGVGIAPMWLYTAQVIPGLTFSNGKAYGRIDIVGISAVNLIEGELRLDRELVKNSGVWVNEEKWSPSTSSSMLTFLAPGVSVTSGTRYRIKFTGTVTSQNGGSEPISGEIIRTAP